jgi:hypothetical protein
MRQLRATNREAAEFAEETVFKAIRDIQALNDNAIRRGDLLVKFWDEERLVREEEKLFIGFNVAASARVQSDEPRSHWGTRVLPGATADYSELNATPTEEAKSNASPHSPKATNWSFDDE